MKGYIRSGFTLIELLIVMAILGVLAVVVLVAINPVQQLARTRDTGRISSVTQVGRALESFYTTHGGRYLDATNCDTNGSGSFNNGDNWLTCLRTTGELSTEPGLIKYSVTGISECAPFTSLSTIQNGLCYTISGSGANAIVYARLESQSYASKCKTPATTPDPYFVWSTFNGRGGLKCTSTSSVPGPGDQAPWDQ